LPRWHVNALARPQACASRAIINSSASWTTEANAIVAPVHAKAMPVILMTLEEADHWLNAETPAAALVLQRPLLDDALRILAKGEQRGRPQ
jgi:putative SOS response-associated peptidase YedK